MSESISNKISGNALERLRSPLLLLLLDGFAEVVKLRLIVVGPAVDGDSEDELFPPSLSLFDVAV